MVAASTYNQAGNAESVQDMIHNITPLDCPFQRMAKQGKASSTKEEWLTKTLRSPVATNQVVEGADAGTATNTSPTRVFNYTEIAEEVVGITDTQEWVKSYGRASERVEQIKNGRDNLKRDNETSLLANKAYNAGNASTARDMAGLPAYLATNESKASDGTAPTGDGSDARSAGTAFAFSEQRVRDVQLACFNNGGNPTTLMLSGFHLDVAAKKLRGSTTVTQDASDMKIFGAVEVWRGPHGMLKLVANRFQPDSMAFLIDPKMVEIRYGQKTQVKELAKTGHARNFLISNEMTLCVYNEKAHGIIADLTTA